MKRRDFIATLGLSLFLPRFVLAQSPGAGKNLIFINLYGGIDGLGAFPYFDGSVANYINTSLRPTLRVPPGQVLPAISQSGLPHKIGFHPSFSPLWNVAKDNMLLVQKYGILGDPGRSHDTCQVLMSIGEGDSANTKNETSGFLARLMDSQNWESFQYWSFFQENFSDINTTKKPPMVVQNLKSLSFNDVGWGGKLEQELQQELVRSLLRIPVSNPLGVRYQRAFETINSAIATVETNIAKQTVGNYSETYFGAQVADVMRVLKAKKHEKVDNLTGKTTLMYLGKGGFDTHSDQNGEEGLAGLLTDLASNLATLVTDLKANSLYNDTVVFLFSEFGRTNHENGTTGASTVGTDHGHGSNTVVFGGAVRGGVIGTPPSLSELQDDYDALVPTLDYRDIVSSILDWAGIRAEDVFNYSPNRLDLFN